MRFDPDNMLANVRAAETDDLLDRATVYRAGMEPEALDLIDTELHRRGITPEQIDEHARQNAEVLTADDGSTHMCSSCRKPAVVAVWTWHRLWGLVPVFPRRFRYCADHRPRSERDT